MATKTTRPFQPIRPVHTIRTLHPWRTFFVACVLYLLLSFREISQWTKPVWFVLAFVAIPAGLAFVLGKGANPGSRFRASLWSVGLAMALYTSINLMRLHVRIGSAGNAANVFFVGVVVSVVYALAATAVCTITGLAWERLAAPERKHDK